MENYLHYTIVYWFCLFFPIFKYAKVLIVFQYQASNFTSKAHSCGVYKNKGLCEEELIAHPSNKACGQNHHQA